MDDGVQFPTYTYQQALKKSGLIMPYTLLQDDKVAMLKKILLLSRMDETELRVLAEKCLQESRGPHVMLFEEGAAGDKMYMIVSGQVIVSRKSHYGQQQIAVLGPGDFFGEIALIKHVPRTARVTTKTACQFLTLDMHNFIQLYATLPGHVRDDMQIIVAKRLAQLRM